MSDNMPITTRLAEAIELAAEQYKFAESNGVAPSDAFATYNAEVQGAFLRAIADLEAAAVAGRK